MKLLKKIFQKSNNKEIKKEENSAKIIEIYSPLYGKIIDLSEIPDEAFAAGVLGDGIGIEPNDKGDIIYSPCNADEVGIFDTNHAITLETENNLEIIIHFGIDTVQLEGKGFERLIKNGSKIEIKQPIMKYDLNFIKSNAKSHKTPIIISNMELVESIEKISGEVKPGDLIMKVKLK